MVLVRSSRPEKASVLLTSIDRWEAYAVQAPQVRLDRWQFAVAEDGRVLVRGGPLPPLPGGRWVDRKGIAVPAGWQWSPPVEASTVRTVFSLEPGDLALWQPDGTWQRIRARISRPRAERLCAPRRRAFAMPLIDDSASARRYLAPFTSSPWRWDDGGEVIAWLDGQTIAFRPKWRAFLPGLPSTDFHRSVRWCCCWPHAATAGEESQTG